MLLRSHKKYSREVSLYEPIGVDKDGESIHLVDVIQMENEDVLEQMILDQDVRELYQAYKTCLNESLRDDFETEEFYENRETRREISTLVAEKLQGRERQIIIMRYGIGGTEPMTQQRVSEILGISRSYVSRLETKAINTLRQELTATANSSD